MSVAPISDEPLTGVKKPRFADNARSLMRLAAPLIMGQIAVVGMTVTDIYIAGQVDADTLAALQLGGSVWMLVAGLLSFSEDPIAAATVIVFFTLANLIGTMLWRRRERLSPYAAIQMLFPVLGVFGLVAVFVQSTRSWPRFGNVFRNSVNVRTSERREESDSLKERWEWRNILSLKIPPQP